MNESDTLAKEIINERAIEVQLFHNWADWPSITVVGKADTGADKSSIDFGLAEAMNWDETGSSLVRTATGSERRKRVRGPVSINGVQFILHATVCDRSEMSHPVLIGHDVLQDLIAIEEEE